MRRKCFGSVSGRLTPRLDTSSTYGALPTAGLASRASEIVARGGRDVVEQRPAALRTVAVDGHAKDGALADGGDVEPVELEAVLGKDRLDDGGEL